MSHELDIDDDQEMSSAELERKQRQSYETLRNRLRKRPIAPQMLPDYARSWGAFFEMAGRDEISFTGKELLAMLRNAALADHGLSKAGLAAWVHLWDTQRTGTSRSDDTFERQLLVKSMVDSLVEKGGSKDEAYRALSDEWGFEHETVKKDYLRLSRAIGTKKRVQN